MPALGAFYEAVTGGHSETIFWWVGGEENWSNVFCAFEGDRMIAKGQAEVFTSVQPGSPAEAKHRIFVNLRALPGKEHQHVVLDAVYVCLLDRARELKAGLAAGYDTLLCVGNKAGEETYNRYFERHLGYRYMYDLCTMTRDLTLPVTTLPLLAGFELEQRSLATEGEQLAYLALEAEIWPETPLRLERLLEYRRNPHWTNWVACEAGAVAGSLMAWEEEGQGMTEDVFVREPWRGRGIAGALLSEALTYLRNAGLASAQLVTRTDNAAALSLYGKLGFITTSLEKRYSMLLE